MASVTGASLVLFFLACAGGILLSALSGRKRAPLVIAIVGTLSSLLMVFAAATVLVTGQSYEASLWTLDGFGRLTLRLDALSSIFLLAAGVVYFSASIFVRNFINDQLRCRISHASLRRPVLCPDGLGCADSRGQRCAALPD